MITRRHASLPLGPGRRFVRLPTTHNPEQSGRRFAATIHNPLPLRGNNPQPIFFLAASRLAAANLEVPNNQNPSSTFKKTNNIMQPATLSRRRRRRRRALEVVTTSKLHVNLRPSRQHTYVLRPRPNRGSHYLRPPPRLLCCALLIQCSRVVIARVQSS